MAVTGSVRINTRLDNSQLMKDCRALKAVVNETANAVKRAFHGREIQALEQQMEATRAAMAPIVQELTEIENRAASAGKSSARDFQKAQAEASKLQQQYDALLNKISEYEAKARAPYDAQIVHYKPTKQDLANNAAVEQQYAAAMGNDPTYQKMIADAEQLRAKQYQVNETIRQMKQAAEDAGGTGSARYTELKGKLEALRGQTQSLNDQLRNLGVTGNSTGGMIASAIGGAATRGFSALQKGAKSALKGFGTLIRSGVDKFTSRMAQSNKGIQTFLSRLGSIAAGALVFNVISAGLAKMTQYIGRALVSSGSLRTALGNLSGAAQTAAAPLIQVLTPALAALANAAATVFSYIARLVAFLTGTTVSAAQQAAEGVAGVGGAAEETAEQVKDANKSLAGFDELERLSEQQTDAGAGGGGGAGNEIIPNYDFEGKSPFLDSLLAAIEAGQWFQVGRLIGEKLRDSLNAIPWPDIQDKAVQWATNIADAINGAVSTPGLWEAIGHTLAQGLNTMTAFVDTFYQGVWWADIGAGLANGLTQLVAEVDWPQLGRTLTDGMRAALLVLHGFVTTYTGWAELGMSIAAMIGAALANIDWVQAAGDLSTLAIGILTAINAALSQADWSSVGQTIMGMVAAIDWLGLIQQLVELLANTWPLVLTSVLLPALGFWITGTLLPAIGAWITGTAIPAILEWLGGILASIVAAIGGWPAALVAALLVVIGALIAVIVANWDAICDWFAGAWDSFVAAWDEFWSLVATNAKNWWHDVTTEWSDFWNGIVDKFNDLKSTLGNAWNSFWNGLASGVAKVWNGIVNTIKSAIDGIIGFIQDLFSAVQSVFNGIGEVISNAGGFVSNIVSSVGQFITGRSAPALPAPESTHSLPFITPKIPYLARGAVIPPNREFLAVLGDQSHGTNVEAPLETIEQAVANVMGNLLNSQMAGFEAVVSVLRDILEAIYGIEIGDDTLARIIRRVNRKQEIMRGDY